ncbi:type 1 glutamine amidotransferase domain-containing protein [Streptomyces sp. NPDC049954]|uniref:type 1 glutamine amidotransferase domain-containing protein n=1 Tax=Streptomyces sp. NPDC049954 TaxID=3155779 RepID=UPI00344405E0
MAGADLSGHRVLALVTNYGVEQDELVVPVEHLRKAGAQVTVAAVKDEPVRTLVSDEDPGTTVRPDTTITDVDAAAYELLLIPGGTLNADSLRLDQDALGVVRSFASAGRPIAAICHGPWALVEAGLVEGKTLTSYPSLRTDIRNAGAKDWVDRSVVTDTAGGYTLVTSRNPGDLDDFLGEVDKALLG